MDKINKQGDEITRYGFIANMESYINRLLKDPIHAQPNEYLKSHGFTGEKTLKYLLNDKIVTRKESIKTDKETNKDKFYIKYTLPNKQNIEKSLRALYVKLFEYHITDNQLLNEEGEGGCYGDCAGATNAESSGQFVQPLFGVQRRKIYNAKPNIKKTEENKKTVYITEEQAKAISKAYKSLRAKNQASDENLDEAMSTANAGDYEYDAPAFSDQETLDHSNMFAKSFQSTHKKANKRKK